MEYQLTLKFKYEAFDDIAAREMAGAIFSEATAYAKDHQKEVKLQQIFPDKQPRKVELFNSQQKEEQV